VFAGYLFTLYFKNIRRSLIKKDTSFAFLKERSRPSAVLNLKVMREGERERERAIEIRELGFHSAPD
jgi:hypothetical protein